MLWRLTKPNLPGCVDAPATTTPFGSKRAWKAASLGRSGIPGLPDLDERVDRDRLAVGDDEWVQVGGLDRRVGGRGGGEADQHVGQGLPVDGRLAAEVTEQRLRGEV